jgi:hypothetical protein
VKSFLKKILFGTNIPQEYLCLAEDGISSPLEIIFHSGDFEADVSATHLFLGYKPVVIGVIFEKGIDAKNLTLPYIDFISHSKRVASLQLKLNSVKDIDGKNLAIYESVEGSHSFVNPLQKQFNSLYQKIQKKKLGNVNLPGNLYEQVKIAYSLPRKICLITLGENNLYNMFPTDLHGMIDDENYVISLRSDGKANMQVNKYKKITLSKMNLNRYRYVYSLGKNHMQELKSRENFEMEGESEKFHLPLPNGAVEYLELEHQSAYSVGIHNLNYFKIVNRKTLAENQPVLSHVHREYFSWALKKGKNIKYLLR